MSSTIEVERDGRVRLFRDYLRKNSIDVAVVQDMQDLYWLCGHNSPGAPRGQMLLVSQTELFVSSRILEVTNSVIHPTLGGSGYVEGECPITHLAVNIIKQAPKTVGLQMQADRLTPADSKLLTNLLNKAGVQIVDFSGVVRAMRASKSAHELTIMRRAGELCAHSMHAAITAGGQPGASEDTVAAAACGTQRNQGGDWVAYPPFVCVGKNAMRGHYAASDALVKVSPGEVLFCELAGCYQRYHVAMMRTMYVGTSLPPAMAKAQKNVKAALQAMREAAVPGAMPPAVHEAAEAKLRPLLADGWIISQRSGYCIGIGFPVDWGEADEIITRSLTDGSEKPLPNNATLHLIPWIRHPVFGCIGISDTVVVQPGGAQSLLPSWKPPEEVILIEPQYPSLKQALSVEKVLGDLIQTPSPLRRVDANEGLGLDFSILIKDEGARLGQKSFKALGGSYAMCCELQSETDAARNTLDQLKRRPGEAVRTFATASDGNHGAGVAWAAKTLGHKAVVYFPRGVAQSRVDTASNLGADVRVSSVSYDKTVALAREEAKKNGWTLVQDTAWPGYTEVPSNIQAAYKLIALEVTRELERTQTRPTHILLQVGVGSFAAAITEFMREALHRSVRVITIEPQGSACLFASLKAGVKTDLALDVPETICAGLDCCVVSDIAWPTLRDEVDVGVTITDRVSADGLRALHSIGFTAGESGAATGVGFLRAISKCPKQCKLLGLNSSSCVLMFNTESTTAPSTTAAILAGERYVGSPTPAQDLKLHYVPKDRFEAYWAADLQAKLARSKL